MIHIKDLIGKQFGKLIIVADAEPAPRQPCGSLARMVYCICFCGKQLSVRLKNLKNGNTKSCGCIHREQLIKRNRTHGQNVRGKRTRIYTIWANMIARCDDKNLANYGGRGITYDSRWNKFENFYEDMGDAPEGLTLDRTDNNGNYYKENCAWRSQKEQCNNTRHNRFIEHKGKRQTIAQWAEEVGIEYGTLLYRLKNGWDIERALNPPIKAQVTKIIYPEAQK